MKMEPGKLEVFEDVILGKLDDIADLFIIAWCLFMEVTRLSEESPLPPVKRRGQRLGRITPLRWASSSFQFFRRSTW